MDFSTSKLINGINRHTNRRCRCNKLTLKKKRPARQSYNDDVDCRRISHCQDQLQTLVQEVYLKPRLHDTTGCQTRCQTGCTTGLSTGCIV